MIAKNALARVPIAVTACAAAGSAAAFSLNPATFGFDPPFAVNNPLLVGSIALLVVGLIAQAIRRATRTPAPSDEAPDLRWWKNP